MPPGCKRVVFGPPDGDPTGDVRAVEGVVGMVDDQMRIALLIQLDGSDLERLQSTPAIWLTMMANHLHPFAVHIADGQELPDAGPPRP